MAILPYAHMARYHYTEASLITNPQSAATRKNPFHVFDLRVHCLLKPRQFDRVYAVWSRTTRHDRSVVVERA
jgi:hypothetical protein